MKVGVPKETKEGERRVALEPGAAATLAADGHEVVVESGAGAGIGHADEAYRAAGARVSTAVEAWTAELIVKVKEIQPEDLPHVWGQAIFGFHHLPGEPERTRSLAARGVTAIAFELVRDAAGAYPLLAPMSVIAGRMAIDVARRHLGRAPERVLVLGAGHAGLSAAQAALDAGARVTVLTRSARSRDLAASRLHGTVDTGIATAPSVEAHALAADLVVGAVFVPSERTPKLLPRSLVARMKRGAMIVDISIDAGGVAETSRPTTHADPTYVADGVVHYCVGNMPAADPCAGAAALSHAVLPYARELAGKGIGRALRENAALAAGVLLWKGRLNHPGIAAEAGLAYTALSEAALT